ncbi:MAG: HK97 gp10 family phage protein [Actinomycetaceae bacterium]|nr:HK97 gp10 family phage protein [Actinomycetaceae bacterium]
MARVQIKLPNDFIDALDSASSLIDNSAEQVLKAGANIVEPRMRSNLSAAIGSSTKQPSRSTGQLAKALGTAPVKVNSRGDYNVKIGFSENRDDGRANALIANVLEHGRSNQPARPFLAPTRSQTKRAAITAMKQTLAARIQQVKP